MQALLQELGVGGTGAQGDRVSGRDCVLCLQEGDAVHFREHPIRVGRAI